MAVPSLVNEQAALKTLGCTAKTTKIVVFEADDLTWKNADENEKRRSFNCASATDQGLRNRSETNSCVGFGVLNKVLDPSASACPVLGWDESG